MFDPACGSGGMFLQSSHFIETQGGETARKVVFYGQEKNPDTIRIARMNLAVHGLDGRIAEAVEAADLDADQQSLLEKLLGNVAIVCAMWLTGFDVESLATLYIDKPMKAHSLMHAIARANRVHPGKDCGVIVDYNGMLKSLRQALAQYSIGDDAIYKKPSERRDTADVTDVLKHLHRIVNAAIRAQEPGGDHAEGLTVDLSRIDFQKLRDEFASKAKRKATVIKDLRELIEAKLQAMLAPNPLRMDFQRKYQEIVSDYNREKDRVTVEATFAALLDLVRSLDATDRRISGRSGFGRPSPNGRIEEFPLLPRNGMRG